MEPTPYSRRTVLRGSLVACLSLTAGCLSAGPRDEPDVTLADLTASVGSLAEDSSLLIAEHDEGTEGPIVHAEYESDRQRSVASAFKLYVLLAVARAVRDGDLAWDDQIQIRDDLRSIPPGATRDAPAGTERSVEQLTRVAIAESDNTATDHLIHNLGRERTAGAFEAADHARPASNQPLPTTREMTLLKFALDAADAEAYHDGSVEVRRSRLERVRSEYELSELDLASWTEPRHVSTLGWFASTRDLHRVLTALLEIATEDRTSVVRDVLSANPGPYEPTGFAYVGHKTGGEPGVLSLARVVERPDGRRFTISLTVNDGEPVSEDDAVAVFRIATRLVREIE